MLKPIKVPKLARGTIKPMLPSQEHKIIPKQTVLTQKRKLLK